MNERKLRTLLHRIVFLAAPLPLGVLGAACGGATSGGDAEDEGGSQNHGGEGATAGTREGPVGGAGATGGTGTGATGGTKTTGGSGGTGPVVDCKAPPLSTSACGPWSVTLPSACVQGTRDLTEKECAVLCGRTSGPLCWVAQRKDSEVIIGCPSTCVEGRRPGGFVECVPEEAGLGSHFVRAAALEAVSVLAFRQLRSELRAHGARRGLLSSLSRAARDERRHTRATRALARRFGGKPSEPSPLEKREVSLEVIATENVVEGCVREAYGAAIATWQAREARDPVVRAAMQRIAREETRHAALSHSLHRWLAQRLDPHARLRVEAAKRRAMAELRDAVEVPYEPGVAEVAGLPSVPRARAIFGALERDLWS